ncbi:hypothetical protein [Mesorhizobium sp. M0276]|uniref:hypothetical protein n=1 Tax=Mesorhizobium sp. M0276 TaxID=2956928 RepID=UPI0033365404
MPAEGDPVAWGHCSRYGGQADSGADGDIEAAGDNDNRLAHRQHAEDGDAETDVEQVSAGEKHIGAQRTEDDDENGERDQQADVVNAKALH